MYSVIVTVTIVYSVYLRMIEEGMFYIIMRKLYHRANGVLWSP